MTNFKATFADGTSITRKSARGYAFAWRATWTDLSGVTRFDDGFSATAENAKASARPYLPFGTWRSMSSKDRAVATHQNEKFLQSCNLKIEIVPTISA